MDVNIQEVDIDLIDFHRMNANEEDSSTFERLKREIQQQGKLLGLPVLIPKPNGRFTCFHGEHRTRAWQSLGHKTVTAQIEPIAFATPEDEFNAVQNMNTVRGQVTFKNIAKRAREHDLDVTKLDVFKVPATALIPSLSKNSREAIDKDLLRQARIREMTMEIAQELATVMIEEKDQLLTFIVHDDKVAAIIRPRLSSKKDARSLAAILETPVKQAIDEAIGVVLTD